MDLNLLLNRLSEANTQAEIYHQCKLLNIKCILEYRINGWRIDVAIFKDNKIVGIIEVKNHISSQYRNRETKQIKKYKSLGYSFFLCSNINAVPQTIKIIQDWINLPEPNHRGISA